MSDFSLGLVTHRALTALMPNEARVAENVDLSKGTIRRRSGWAKIHTADLPSTTEPVRALFARHDPGGSHSLLAVQGTSLLKSTGSDFSTIGTFGVASPIRATFAQVGATTYIALASGSSSTPQILHKSDGTSLSTVSGAPTGRFVLFHKDSLWVAGAPASNPSRLYWSKFASIDVENFPGTNFIDIDPQDGDRITGLATLQGALVVFKERSIHRIVGQQPNEGALSTGDAGVSSYPGMKGCHAPRTISVQKNLAVYLNREGIYGFDGVNAVELTESIRNLFLELDEEEVENAVGAFIGEGHYLLSVVTEGSDLPNLLISLRLNPTRSISIWRGQSIEELAVGDETGITHTRHALEVYAIAEYHFGESTFPVLGFPGMVGKLDGSDTDNGDRIRWVYSTALLDMGDPKFHKRVRRGWLTLAPGTGLIEVRMLPNFETVADPVVVDPTAVFTHGEDAITIPLHIGGQARRWSIEFSGESNGPDAEIQEVVVEYIPRFRF